MKFPRLVQITIHERYADGVEESVVEAKITARRTQTVAARRHQRAEELHAAGVAEGMRGPDGLDVVYAMHADGTKEDITEAFYDEGWRAWRELGELCGELEPVKGVGEETAAPPQVAPDEAAIIDQGRQVTRRKPRQTPEGRIDPLANFLADVPETMHRMARALHARGFTRISFEGDVARVSGEDGDVIWSLQRLNHGEREEHRTEVRTRSGHRFTVNAWPTAFAETMRRYTDSVLAGEPDVDPLVAAEEGLSRAANATAPGASPFFRRVKRINVELYLGDNRVLGVDLEMFDGRDASVLLSFLPGYQHAHFSFSTPMGAQVTWTGGQWRWTGKGALDGTAVRVPGVSASLGEAADPEAPATSRSGWSGTDLRAWRQRMGWSQPVAAAELGIHEVNLSKTENGRHEVRPTIRRLAECLELLAAKGIRAP